MFPYLTHEAYKSSEKFRKKKALTKKNTDEEITNSRKKSIDDLNKRLKVEKEMVNELELVSEHLNDDRRYSEDNKINQYRKMFRNKVLGNENQDRIFLIMDNYNISDNRFSFIENLKIPYKEFMIDQLLINYDKSSGKYYITDFGVFISKNRLYNKFYFLEDLEDYTDFNLS